ncbi:MAG: hypothetical protein NT169_27555 [Chloroflexi bacterium]|nr:hypothetical protein [Chloroflexota bacterium]
MNRIYKSLPWHDEAGVQNIEWLTLVAIFCITLLVAGSTIQIGGRSIGGRMVGQISCWVTGWDGSQACSQPAQSAASQPTGSVPQEPAAVTGQRQSLFSYVVGRGRVVLRSFGITVGDSSSYVDLDASSELLGAYSNRYDNPLVQDSALMMGWRYNVYTGDWEQIAPQAGTQHGVDPLEQMMLRAELCALGSSAVTAQDCKYLYTGVFDPSFYARGGPAMTSRRSGFATNLLAILAVAFALFAILVSRRSSQEAPRAVDWQILNPGRTTQTDLETLLGKPAEIELKDGLEWLRYPSGNPLLPNLFAIQNRVLVMADIGLDAHGATANELGRRYGAPEKVAYSRFARGARAFIWARQGVTLIADWESGRPYRIRRYEPMPLDQFMRQWGTNLPDEDPYQK